MSTTPLSTALTGNLITTGGLYSFSASTINTAANTSASIQANGTIKCQDLEIEDLSMKKFVEEIAEQIALFIPPDLPTMDIPAVQKAYEDYIDARDALLKAHKNLEFVVELCKQHNKS